jgi:hypothetical protein
VLAIGKENWNISIATIAQLNDNVIK